MFCLNEIHKWEISAIVTPERCPYIKRLSEKKKNQAGCKPIM